MDTSKHWVRFRKIVAELPKYAKLVSLLFDPEDFIF